MVRTVNLVPEVYYNRSRDFQALGRVYDIVFNYLKTNIDVINNLPVSDTIDEKLLDLVASTLGFKQMHNYNVKHLRGLCSIFMYIVRNKGTVKAIKTVADMLLHIEGISGEAYVEVERTKKSGDADVKISPIICIYVPKQLTNTTLLTDVLDYVIPAGMKVEIRKKGIIKANTLKDTYANVENTITKGIDGTTATVKSATTAIIPQYIGSVAQAQALSGTNDTMTIPQYNKDEGE